MSAAGLQAVVDGFVARVRAAYEAGIDVTPEVLGAHAAQALREAHQLGQRNAFDVLRIAVRHFPDEPLEALKVAEHACGVVRADVQHPEAAP